MTGLCFRFFALVLFFSSPPIRSGEAFSSVIFFLSFSSFICFFGYSDGMEREACVCDHGFERSDLSAEIIIIIIIIITEQRKNHGTTILDGLVTPLLYSYVGSYHPVW